jgi:uncharacterized protein
VISRIIDIHQHIGSLELISYTGMLSAQTEHADTQRFEQKKSEDEEDMKKRTAIMDKFGITHAAMMPSLQYERPQGQQNTIEINNLVSQYKQKYKDRFPVALGTVEPLHGVENGLEEIERSVTQLGIDGFVWHHRLQGTFIADSRMWPFLRKINEFKLPVFIHVFGNSGLEAPWGVEVLASDFPEVKFVCLDVFSNHTYFRQMLNICRRLENVLVDTAALSSVGRPLDEFVRQLGSERVVFGTDLYLHAPDYSPQYNVPYALYEVRESSSMSDRDKENILWNNASKLFHLN